MNENKLTILYEDNHLIVVLKPQNVPSQGDSTGDTDLLTMVKDYIKTLTTKKARPLSGWCIGLTDLPAASWFLQKQARPLRDCPSRYARAEWKNVILP